MGVSGQRHAPAALCSWEKTPGTHCTGGWVGLRADLDTEVRGKILCLCRGSNPGRSDTTLTELSECHREQERKDNVELQKEKSLKRKVDTRLR
jgi:hypothetical protein